MRLGRCSRTQDVIEPLLKPQVSAPASAVGPSRWTWRAANRARSTSRTAGGAAAAAAAAAARGARRAASVSRWWPSGSATVKYGAPSS